MLDAVAADSDFAVESVRAKRRSRTSESPDSPVEQDQIQRYRDPGYSQAVRRTCQQRMVQLIPVRRGTLAVVLTCMWLLWGTLLLSHYLIFTRQVTDQANGTAVDSTFASLPIAQLFHLRSPHSIAQWLNSQLWMLTAVAAWMIFQLRRHKLDDYRARYRVWVVLAIAAVFSSFEASSSMLMLLGLSIDGWARQEIGYPGWPLVLASFASIIGVLGIRLCGELKSAPTSVVSWLLGLVAWALAAVLGTGLLKLSWSPATIDLIVGGSLLGGILAVFQASGIYLRQTYIHAQKRFLVRNGANLEPIKFKVPKLSLRRKVKFDEHGQPLRASVTKATSSESKWKMPWLRKQGNDSEDFDQDTARSTGKEPTNKTTKIRETSDKRGETDTEARATRSSNTYSIKSSERNDENKNSTADRAGTPKKKTRLFGLIPNRNELNERLDDDAPIRQDDGPVVDQGLTKKRGWFGIGGNRNAEIKSPALGPRSAPKPPSSEFRHNDGENSEAVVSQEKKSYWSRRSSDETKATKAKLETKSVSTDAAQSKRGWISKFSKSRNPSDGTTPDLNSSKSNPVANKPTVAKTASEQGSSSSDAANKKSWLSFASKKTSVPKEPKVVAKKPEKSVATDTAKSGRRGLFGMLDGLKLKPPTEDSVNKDSAPSTKPVPINQKQPIPSTQPNSDEEDGDDDYSGRPLSKADRKKLRRQGLDDRRAA